MNASRVTLLTVAFLLVTLCALFLAPSASATTVTQFDHIGSLPSPYTDNFNVLAMFDSLGGLTHDWRRTGVRWIEQNSGTVDEVSFIVLTTDPDVTNIDNSDIRLHFWNGYEDSFALHPWEGDRVNQIDDNVTRTITPFTTVGPTGTEFQTFKVTFDLSVVIDPDSLLPSPVLLQAGQEYVMAPVGLDGGQLRLSLSDPPDPEDLVDVQAAGTNQEIILGSRTLDTFALANQYGASLSVTLVPEPSTLVLGFLGVLSLAILSRPVRRKSVVA